MKRVLVLNGPNINFLGIREPEIYGKSTYKDLVSLVEANAPKYGFEVEFYQSNHEGALIDRIQSAYYEKIDGIIFNPAGYTHTSIAILDALKAVGIPVVEVHLSHVESREDFRQISYVSMVAIKTITGMGIDGYVLALSELKEYLDK